MGLSPTNPPDVTLYPTDPPTPVPPTVVYPTVNLMELIKRGKIDNIDNLDHAWNLKRNLFISE